jgi:hypothetical protein
VADRITHALFHLILFVAASAVAALLAVAIWTQLPSELDVHTDIVGYPIHSNFNSYRYFWLYWLLVGFIPVVTLAVLVALRRLTSRRRGPVDSRPRRLGEQSGLPVATPTEIVVVGISRMLFVGAIFALEAVAAASRAAGWIFPIGIPVTAGYALLVSLAALALGRVWRSGSTFWDRAALVNAVAVPFSVAGLYAVSRTTEVKVMATGSVHEYSWLPIWLAAGLTVPALAWALRAGIRARVGAELRALERRLLLVVAGPVALLLLLAVLPGALGGFDWFHDGELLAGAQIVQDGAFPWRDVIFIHGLLTDAVFQLVGFNLFEQSRWGYSAGAQVVIVPVYWIFLYYLCAWLFHRNWLFLVGTQLAVIVGVVYETNLRFIALPLVFVLLGALLAKPSWIRAVAFMALLTAQTIVTPEAGIAAFAALAVLVAFEGFYYDRHRSLSESFPRTLSCLAAGISLTVVWAVFLLAFGALDDFVSVSIGFAGGHQLTGAIPVTWFSDRYRFDSLTPAVLVVVAFWYFAVHILRRASLTIADWVVGAIALFVALYYHKFLARTDHGLQPYAVALPVLFYAVYRLLGVAEEGLRRLSSLGGIRLPIRFTATLIGLGVLLLYAPLGIGDVVRNAPYRLDATVAAEAQTPRIGYLNPEGYYDKLLGDVGAVLRANLGPHDALFDFSNNPALFHYLLGRKPATRYYHVSLAIRSKAQAELIDELEAARPKLVVFSSSGIGLPVWDGISNQVRHYLVSDYLLDNYRPLTSQEGFVFMVRKEARVGPGTNQLYFRTYPCGWGFAPNFLSVAPAASSPPAVVAHHDLGEMGLISGWAVDQAARAPAARVVAKLGGKIVAQDVPFSPRVDVVERFGEQRYLLSGFFLQISSRVVPSERLDAVRVYAAPRSGTATELGSSETGAVDSVSTAAQVVALDVPPTERRNAYAWIEIETPSPLTQNAFVLSDHPAASERGISFATLARGERRVRVMVGACSQWHGFRSGRLYLRAERPIAIRAVRLYR